MRMSIERLLLAAVALALVAWLAIDLRDSVLVTRVQHVVFERSPSAGALGRGLADVRDAKLLNPDRSLPLSYEAELFLLRGDTRGAVRVYQQMVQEEPKFAEAWFLLASVSAQVDPALSARARAEVRRLDPLDRGASGG